MGWAPLGAMFIARLSRGRRIRSVIMFNFILPSIVVAFWLTSFAGIAINMQDEAITAGITCDMYEGGQR